MEFMQQHEELYNKTHMKFKDKQRMEGLWERLAASRNYPSTLSRSGSRRAHQIWQAHSHEAKTSCSEEHQKRDLVERQF